MTFEEAEIKYRELRGRMKTGVALSRVEFESQVRQLAVSDMQGTWWEIQPEAACWMYYDGRSWVRGAPPGRNHFIMPSDSNYGIPPGPSVQTSPPDSHTQVEPGLPTKIQRPSRLRLESDRESTPVGILVALGAGVLCVCTILAYLGWHTLWGNSNTQVESTRTPVVQHVITTVVPTILNQPSLALPTATPSPVYAKVIEPRVNVRSAPSLDAKIVDKVAQDDQIKLIGRNEDGTWFNVVIPTRSDSAWIFGETVEIASGDVQSLPIVPPPPP